MHTERELKFVADRATLRAALALRLPGAITCGPVSQALKSTYFDTEALELTRRGVSLRVRQSGGNYVLGVKRDFMLTADISSATRRKRRCLRRRSTSTSSNAECLLG